MTVQEKLKTLIIHDCARSMFRDPIGAVKEGEAVTLRLCVHDTAVINADIVLFSDNETKTIRMSRKTDAFEASTDIFSHVGVYFYYFILRRASDMFYYGLSKDPRVTCGQCSFSVPAAFQITVYKHDFETPLWFRKSVMYQIFPDRYARGSDSRIRSGLAYHRSVGQKVYLYQWNDAVKYLPEADEKNYYPNDFFGGTLDAIREDLMRLKKLGIDTIYLNPVFESNSNHRYDTSDYTRIDPILGENEDFRALCAQAEKFGIHILLDGVFSHTGADSIYFNRFGHYPSPGACQGDISPYYQWYQFFHFPDRYKCWWGFESLPEVDEHDLSWQNYMLSGENSVLRHWLREGASGYRLDVADELPDDVIELIRTCAKAEKPDAVILGEVWEDPTVKTSMGQRRKYALGACLDSVMNYPLRHALIDFAIGLSDAGTTAAFILRQRLNYPPPLYCCLMNLLSSHDCERVRSVLSRGAYADGMPRQQQADFHVCAQQDKLGAERQLMLASVQFTLPGVPCIYYGDEYGMHGLLDPFNRAPLGKNASPYKLDVQYARLAALRHAHPAFSSGEISVFSINSDVLCVIRADVSNTCAYGADEKNEAFAILANRAQAKQHIVCDIYTQGRGMDQNALCVFRASNFCAAADVFKGTEYPLSDGLIDIVLPPCSAVILELIPKTPPLSLKADRCF